MKQAPGAFAAPGGEAAHSSFVTRHPPFTSKAPA